jgi:hypothetical protein
MTSSGSDEGNGRRSGGGMSSPPGLEQIAELRAGRWPSDMPPYEDLPPATREIIDSLLGDDIRLLPTPKAADGENASEQGPRHYLEGSDNPTLLGAARRTTGELRHSEDPDLPPTPEPSDESAPGIAWGVYEAAIRRWERILGRPAPVPTDEKGRLAPAFVEWMLGYPEGWVSAIDIPRTAQLRILGNSVQVDCGERVGEWLARLSFSGII